MKYRIIAFIALSIASLTSLHAQERGKASYYSSSLTGRMMSSGIRYHKDSLFCAHKQYAFGTLLKVVNPSNGKSVVVKVTDRGPHTRGRIIDLSYRAAKELGIVSAGVATVEVSVWHPEKGIPFKLDPETELPELELKITDNDGYEPAWMAVKREKEKEKKKSNF